MKKCLNSIKNVLKTPIRINYTAIFLPVLIIHSQGILGILLYILLLVSVMLHEYAHAWAAHYYYNINTTKITIGFWGGAAEINIPLDEHIKDLVISVAGPLMSFFLSFIFFTLCIFIDNKWIITLGYVNLIIGVFNLLPLFPTDGGRILFASLAMAIGGPFAIQITSWISLILCGVLGAVSLYYSMYLIFALFVFLIILNINQKRLYEDLYNTIS